MSVRPNYFRVYATFFRNAVVREMTFRGNFLFEVLTRMFWFVAQITLFEIIYRGVTTIDDWTREEYFAFMATGMLVNALIESFFMPNFANLSELIRTGNLDFALLKPIDTQFLISFEKLDLSMLSQILLATCLLVYALAQIGRPISATQVCMYVLLLGVGVTFFYSLMLVAASTSIFFVRNQGLYDYWFYITIFARYPMTIYSGSPTGEVIRFVFAYVLPILLVVTVPARILLSKALEPSWLAMVLVTAAAVGLFLSRAIFQWSLTRYRSASS